MRLVNVAALSAAMGLCFAFGCAKAPMAPIEEGLTPVHTDQPTRGGQLFAAKCSKCHGNDGKGTHKAPAVVGQGALPLEPPAGAKFRKTQFRTAKDVLAFIKEKMPADNPGSLSNGDYEAILAFDLKANGVELQSEQVSAANAAEYVLHP